MSGYAITDTHASIADTPDSITAAITGIKPAAGVLADLVSALNNVPVRVFVLRVTNTDAGAGDTFSIYRIATGGTPGAINALALGVPIDVGEAQFFDNILVDPGFKLVVISTNGRVTFSGDIGEEP